MFFRLHHSIKWEVFNAMCVMIYKTVLQFSLNHSLIGVFEVQNEKKSSGGLSILYVSREGLKLMYTILLHC